MNKKKIPGLFPVFPVSVEKGGGDIYSFSCNEGWFIELDRVGEEENETESLGCICGEVGTLVVSDLFKPNFDACCNNWLVFRCFLSICSIAIVV